MDTMKQTCVVFLDEMWIQPMYSLLKCW